MLESWDVEVAQEPDGDILIWQRVRMSDGSGGEGRGWGPCPTPEEPLKGPGSFEPGVGHVHTVAPAVDKVLLRLSDGSEHSPELHEIEGGNARWFRHEIADSTVSPAVLWALASNGEEIGRTHLHRPPE